MNDFIEQFRRQDDLQSWIRQELDRIDAKPSFKFSLDSGKRNFCTVLRNDREIYLTADEMNHHLSMAFAGRGVSVGHLFCNSIDTAITAIMRFLHYWDNTIGMREYVSDYAPSDIAFIHEEGPAAEVRSAWIGVLNFFEQIYPHGIKLLTCLRKTEPYASMFPVKSWDCISFSRCTGYPFTMDGPVIRPLTEERAQICDFSGRPLFEGSNIEVIESMKRFTPSDWNRASQGNNETFMNYD